MNGIVRRLRRGAGVVLAGILSALLVFTGVSLPAHAQDTTLRVTMPDPVGTHNGNPVYGSGPVEVEIGYGAMPDGYVATIELPEQLRIDGALNVDVASNDALESVTVDDSGNIVVTFADPFPANINQGQLLLNLTIDPWETSTEELLVWNIDGDVTEIPITILADGDSPKNVTDSQGKNRDWSELPAVTIDDDGNVVLGDAWLDAEIPYSVTVNSADGGAIVLEDTLDEGLAFVDGSFSGSLTTWDEDGLNREGPDTVDVTPSVDGGAFTYTHEAPQNSEFTLTYAVKIADEDALLAFQAELQEQYDAGLAGDENGDGFSYSITKGNTITFNGSNERRGTFDIGGSQAGETRPGWGSNEYFNKIGTPREVTIEQPDGTELVETIPVTYDLVVDLRDLASFDDTRFALDANVVVEDTLPTAIEWLADGDAFITAEGITLTAYEGAPLTAAEFAADEYVGQYLVDGKTLLVNVGQDTSTGPITITAQAEIVNLEDVTVQDWNLPSTVEAIYAPRNEAVFHYGQGETTRGYNHSLIVEKEPGSVIEDSNVFNKTTDSGEISVTRGESASIVYTFTVGDGIGEIRDATIIDDIDHSVFDVSDETIDAIKSSITGQLDWWLPLEGSMFDVSLNDDGQLLIQPNAAFPEGDGGRYAIDVTLQTHPIEGKQTIEISNSASLQGSEVTYSYASGSSTSATSFGSELEVRKRLYDADGDAFTSNLRVELDEFGNLVEDEFVYRIELLPHGQFRNMVHDVVDVLPEGVEFVGFVTEWDFENTGGENPTAGPITLPNTNVQVSYDTDANSVRVERGQLNAGQISNLYFKIQVTDFTEGVGITNIVGSTDATIVPANDFPLNLSKIDANDPDNRITDLDARFTLRDAAGDVIADDIFVYDGKLRVAGENEGDAPVVVRVAEPGTYTIEETVAPSGYALTDEVFTLTIDERGVQSPSDVRILNEEAPAPKTYAIGDIVWIDDNKDGLQGDGEFLDDVTVKLFQKGADGEFVEIAETVTRDGGRYIFDNLPEGEYEVQFELTPEQAEIYEFTQPTVENGDAAEDSDAVVGDDPAIGRTGTIVLNDETAGLTLDYTDQEFEATQGIDPTWDAGVIVKDVAPEPDPVVGVGDYVWVDTDRDGRQGDPETEPGIPGVVLEILDPSGDPVLDEDGDPRTVTTDENGRYWFGDLPVIGEDESYTVRIVRDDPSTVEALKPYVPTISDGGEGDDDSSTWEASSVLPLTEDGAEDPTLDFGFVTKTYAIGDVVWIDADGDGLQGDGEFLEGVTVTLLDADGNPVEGVEPQVTDAAGRYVFDELPAGEYRVHFELTSEQAEVYEFTQQGVETDDANADSDADTGTGVTGVIVLGDDNAELIPASEYDYNDTIPVLATEGIDPTWDAGVVLKDVTPDPEPTDPVDPEPTDPEPTDPVEPEPTDPEPTDPVDPEPTDPVDPEPTDPEPTDPVEPEPTDPEPTDPVDPEPTDPEPTDPVEPEPTDPEPTDPVDPEPTDPVDPEPTDPEPTDPVEPEPTDPEPTDPVEPEPSDPVAPEPVDPEDPESSDELPRTGGELTAGLLWMALALLLAGAFTAMRRKQTSQA